MTWPSFGGAGALGTGPATWLQDFDPKHIPLTIARVI